MNMYVQTDERFRLFAGNKYNLCPYQFGSSDLGLASSSVDLPILKMPTPGRFYEIQQGKGGLETTAHKAYKTKSNSEQVERAQEINNHPLNRKFWRKPENAHEKKFYPDGIIEFSPNFTCDKDQRRAKRGEKKCFASIWIPVKEIITHPRLGRGIDFPENVLLSLLKPTGRVSSAELGLLQDVASVNTTQRSVPKKVSNANAVPYRFICSIITTIRHPTSRDVVVTFPPATGTLIGFRHILTAAHVLSLKWLDGSILRADKVFVTPMHFSTSGLSKEVMSGSESDVLHAVLMSKRPLGSYLASSYHIHRQFRDTPGDIFDIALIKLGTNVGKLPWAGERFGYWGSSSEGGGTILSSTANDAFERLIREKGIVRLSGYPISRIPDYGINQWEGIGPTSRNIPEYAKSTEKGWMRLGYQIVSEEGHSGSPVWIIFNSGGKTIRKLVAVHSDGGHGIFAASGVLITPATFDWIRKSLLH
jgi:V8-like Glu-specific endopeptidase